MKKPIYIVAAILIVTALAAAVFIFSRPTAPVANTPNTNAPSTNTNTGWVNPKSNLIRVNRLKPGDAITNPMIVSGEARGYWFFEASFPIHVYDSKGVELGVAVAQAQDEWMTEEFVPFEAELIYNEPATETGALVFKKDNPSGLPEHDDELRIDVRFDTTTVVAKKCRITGCSNHVCSDEETITTCEYREEYACYKTATCERQDNGDCGWTQTTQLKTCLESKVKLNVDIPVPN